MSECANLLAGAELNLKPDWLAWCELSSRLLLPAIAEVLRCRCLDSDGRFFYEPLLISSDQIANGSSVRKFDRSRLLLSGSSG